MCQIHLAKSRVLHDALEGYYKEAMDYGALDLACAAWETSVFRD